MSKYHNIHWPDASGFVHDSKKEAQRANELLLMQRAGLISDLLQQVPYVLIPSQKREDGRTERGVTYVADFVYTQDGKTVVEDTKGMLTGEYVIKRKLMKYIWGIEVQEI